MCVIDQWLNGGNATINFCIIILRDYLVYNVLSKIGLYRQDLTKNFKGNILNSVLFPCNLINNDKFFKGTILNSVHLLLEAEIKIKITREMVLFFNIFFFSCGKSWSVKAGDTYSIQKSSPEWWMGWSYPYFLIFFFSVVEIPRQYTKAGDTCSIQRNVIFWCLLLFL